MIFAHVYAGMFYDFYEGLERKPTDKYRIVAGARWLEQPTSDNLHLTCRQIHAEMALLPYVLGSFQFRFATSGLGGLCTLKGFLRRRTTEQIDAMANLELSQWSQVLHRYWCQHNTAAYWVAKLEVLSASVANMTPKECLDFYVSSLGPRGSRATLSQTG